YDSQKGGGLYISSGNAQVVNCTAVYNAKQGIFNSSGSLDVVNSILYFNTLASINGLAGVKYCDIEGGWEGTGNINYDPTLLSSSELIIVAGSPCIDMGDPDPHANDGCQPPALGGVRNDIGAHGGPGSCLWASATAVDHPEDLQPPLQLALSQNYPNPFNSTTTIHYRLTRSNHVSLNVYNILGQRVSILIDDFLTAGDHLTHWDGRDWKGDNVASGVYCYRLVVGQSVWQRKMLLLK
ncbi:MAG: T9SS type A sorting domain-containing protein, partial [bacterium]